MNESPPIATQAGRRRGGGRAVVTIVAKNYLAAARVLCRSVAQHDPGVRRFVLFVDDLAGFVDPAAEPFEALSIDQLGFPQLDRGFRFKYDVTELSTAVKPYLLEHLLARHKFDGLLYLDPDILVTGTLGGLFAALDAGRDAVLTPHLDADFPPDGRRPDDAHVLTSGCYNLGFLGVSGRPGAMAFLRWWQGKLYDHCLIDHARGYFVDQRFADLAVTLFDGFHVERDVGYNVAYWNLHGRRVGRDPAGRWTCNGGPLHFFHFSNYKPERPDEISGHQDRLSFAGRPDLVPIFAEYRRLLAAEGHDVSRAWPYTWATFDTGERIPRVARRAYLDAGAAGRPAFGPDPFASPALKAIARREALWRRLADVTRGPRLAARRLARAVGRRS